MQDTHPYTRYSLDNLSSLGKFSVGKDATEEGDDTRCKTVDARASSEDQDSTRMMRPNDTRERAQAASHPYTAVNYGFRFPASAPPSC